MTLLFVGRNRTRIPGAGRSGGRSVDLGFDASNVLVFSEKLACPVDGESFDHGTTRIAPFMAGCFEQA